MHSIRGKETFWRNIDYDFKLLLGVIENNLMESSIDARHNIDLSVSYQRVRLGCVPVEHPRDVIVTKDDLVAVLEQFPWIQWFDVSSFNSAIRLSYKLTDEASDNWSTLANRTIEYETLQLRTHCLPVGLQIDIIPWHLVTSNDLVKTMKIMAGVEASKELDHKIMSGEFAKPWSKLEEYYSRELRDSVYVPSYSELSETKKKDIRNSVGFAIWRLRRALGTFRRTIFKSFE